MELKEAIEQRHSIRNYSDELIDINIINEILKYADMAPSAGNLKARKFIIVTDQKIKDLLSEAAYNQKYISQAPVNIAICADLKRIEPYGERGKQLYCIQDSSASAENILLLAVDYGLGACWIGAFDEKKVSEILDLSSNLRPVIIISIGKMI